MPLYFFPRERGFWLYHGAATLLGLAAMVAIAVIWGGVAVGYKIACTLAWMPLYTLAVLGYRWLYRRCGGGGAPMGRLIAASVLYSAVAGLLIGVAVICSVAPFYWADFVAKFKYFGRVADPWEFFRQNLMEMGPQNQLFISVWAFIYISVATSRRVRLAELSNLRLQNNLKEAQLSSLSNQLNPHFLFNSLNNIRFMIHENAQQADSMITAFSEILRYSLESSHQDKISLGQEAAIIGKYIAIVSAQLEDRLRFSMRIAPGLDSALLPPMVVQMLAENAIKHGIDHLRDGGALSIDAIGEHAALVITVRNDIPPQAAPAGTGIGLRNIEQRLQLLYGGRAGLCTRREAGQFSAILTLPLERAA